jgi:DNA polymerase-3 subunit beta
MPMEFTIDQAQLVRGLQRTQSIVERRSTMPILANVLLAAEAGRGGGQVELAATDLEVGVRTTVPAEHVAGAGRLTVHAKKLYEIARELPAGSVRVVARDNQHAELSAGKVVVTLVGLSAEEFPAIPGRADAAFAPMDLPTVRAMIEGTLYAASSDETRYNLNGVFLERVEKDGAKAARMVATDGHRLALVDRPIAGGLDGLSRGVILPRKGLSELKRLLDEVGDEGGAEGSLKAAFRENSGLFLVGDTLLVMRLIEGAFPDYRQVIPRASDGGARVDREALARALRRISIVSAEKSRAVKLALAPGALEISTTNPDLGEAKEELEMEYSGRPITVGFNARYLLDFLAVTHTDTVVLDLADETSPGLLRGLGEEGHLGVVMPMRI